MSITDELRKYARGYKPMVDHTLLEIADRIDEAHESSYKDGYDEGFASADDYFTDKRETLEEHGWVKLPVDADGVPIHVGDVVEVINGGLKAEACYMQIGPSGIWSVGLTKRCHWYDTESLRHHTPPTVEDVLLEACKAYHGLMVESMSDVAHDMQAPSEVIAEYAAKLMLKENE